MEIEKLLENMRYCCGDMGYDDECSDHCIDPRDNRENEEEPRFCRQWLIRDAANVIEELQNQFAAVTAERDAAVNDAELMRKTAMEDCGTCDCQHVKDLLAAEKDGRLVVLPCKVGDTVWKTKAVFSYFSKPMEDRIERIIISAREILVCCTSGTKFEVGSIGKTVFLSPEKARAALGGES